MGTLLATKCPCLSSSYRLIDSPPRKKNHSSTQFLHQFILDLKWSEVWSLGFRSSDLWTKKRGKLLSFLCFSTDINPQYAMASQGQNISSETSHQNRNMPIINQLKIIFIRSWLEICSVTLGSTFWKVLSCPFSSLTTTAVIIGGTLFWGMTFWGF